MSGRRRRDGDRGGDEATRPRVRGAWTTPAVVVRGPDGKVIDHGKPWTHLVDSPPETSTETGKRPRPRRIPGAVGAALVAPRLSPEAADDRDGRRARRQAAPAASVTRLVPRRRPAGADDAPAWPGLRSVATRVTRATRRTGRAARRTGRAAVPGRRGRRPAPSRPGEPRRSRVLAAVAGIEARLAGPDEETRERRRAQLRWIGTRLGAFALVGVLLYAIFPVRTYLAQRAAAERGREQVEVINRENQRLAQRAHDLQDKDTIEEMAREKLGLVKPGEESYGILPAPQEAPAPSTTTTAPGPPD